MAEETLSEASRRLAVTRKIDRLAHAKQKAKADKEWRQTNAEELGIILSESESDEDLQEYHQERSAKRLAAADERTLRAELDRMLTKPLGAHRHSLIGSAKFPTRGGGDALIRAKRARALEEDAVSAADMLGRRRGGGGEKKSRRPYPPPSPAPCGRRHGQTSQEVLVIHRHPARRSARDRPVHHLWISILLPALHMSWHRRRGRLVVTLMYACRRFFLMSFVYNMYEVCIGQCPHRFKSCRYRISSENTDE